MTRCTADTTDAEWRNKQSGMSYRRLGRTNFMVSEIIMGGSPPPKEDTRHFDVALELGLNYLDCAVAYGRGEGEKATAPFLNTSSKRERVFLNTKVSYFDETRKETGQAIYDALTATQKAEIDREVERRLNAGVSLEPNHTIDYFREGQYRLQLQAAFISDAVKKRYPDALKQQVNFKDFIIKSVEESMARLQTDYLDIVMCPHGVSSPGEMESEEIQEAFLQLRKAGKVRYLGASAHADPSTMVKTAARLGNYDVVMPAFNFVNGKYFTEALGVAKKADMGIIAMKPARALHTGKESNPSLRPEAVEALHKAIPGSMSTPMKANLWVLQQPGITAINSSMVNEEQVRQNLSLAGRKIDLPDEYRITIGDD